MKTCDFATTCVVLAIVAVLAGGAAARLVVPERWERLTLITVDGWEYADVTVEVIDGGEALWVIRPDGARRRFAATEVRELQDAIGRDVTAHVIPGWQGSGPTGPPPATGNPPPQEAPWQLPTVGARDVAPPAAAAPSAPRLRFAVALSGGAGYGRAYGDWFADLEEGESFYGQLRFAMTPNLYLLGGYRHQRLRPARRSGEGTGGDATLDQLFFGVGLMPRPAYTEQAIPFLELGFGRTLDDRHLVLAAADGAVCDYRCAEGTQRLVFAQIGVIVPFGRDIALELGVNAINVGEDLLGFDADAAAGTVVAAQAGLTILLGQGG